MTLLLAASSKLVELFPGNFSPTLDLMEIDDQNRPRGNPHTAPLGMRMPRRSFPAAKCRIVFSSSGQLGRENRFCRTEGEFTSRRQHSLYRFAKPSYALIAESY